MNVILTQPVEIALRTLGDDDQRRVRVWIDYLRNWEKDTFVREHSQKLNAADSVYVFKTSSDIRIFFRVEKDRIVILDIATKATILSSGNPSGTGQ
jgi:hypothetical protein